MSDKLKERQNLAVKSVAIDVQDEINLAFRSSEGYSREFKIPETINGANYKINITEEMVYVRTDDGKYAIALPVRNITGDVNIGSNTIKKENEEIKLNVN